MLEAPSPKPSKRGPSTKAVPPASAPAATVAGYIPFSGADLVELSASAKIGLSVHDEGVLAEQAALINRTMQQFIMSVRLDEVEPNGSDVLAWLSSLEKWVSHGATLLGAPSDLGSTLFTSPDVSTTSESPIGHAVSHLLLGWPDIPSNDAATISNLVLGYYALERDLKQARIIQSSLPYPANLDPMEWMPAQPAGQSALNEREVANELTAKSSSAMIDKFQCTPSDFSQYDVTRDLVVQTIAALSVLRRLTFGAQQYAADLPERPSQTRAQRMLLRQLAYPYETLHRCRYTTSTNPKSRLPVGPAIRWTRGLFHIFAARSQELFAECDKERTKHIPPMPEFQKLVDWANKPHWGKEVIRPVAFWEARGAQGLKGSSDL